MAKNPSDTREFTDAGVSSSRSMLDSVRDTDNYRTQVRTLATGNEVTLRTKGGEPQIWGEQDEELFLDNGFLKQGAYGVLNTDEEAQYKNTAKNTSTDNRYLVVKQIKPPFKPKVFKSFFRSHSTRGSETGPAKPEKIDALKAKNRAVLTCPPTMFTGLMRRYVAALYGKRVSDAAGKDLTASPSGAETILTYGGVSFYPGLATTGIVYSATLKKYWMVNLSDHNFVYQDMLFSEIGHDLVRQIKPTNTAEQNKLLQTYALSEAMVRTNDDGVVEWRNGGSFPALDGQPISFGWRFNSYGTQATMCTIEKPNLTFNSSRRYQATISISENTAIPVGNPLRYTLEVAVTKAEEVLLWSSARIKVFYPLAMGQYDWLRTGYTDGEAANAPLISFYDDADGLQVCRFNKTLGATSSSTEGEFTGNVLTPDGHYPTITSPDYYGWGSGYTFNRRTIEVGDKAAVTLGGFSGVDTRLTDNHSEEYVVTVGAESLIGLTPGTAGTIISIGYGEFGINGVENTNLAATWPATGQYNTYRSGYSWDASGQYIGQDITQHIMMLIAPHDNATAWIETQHYATVQSTIQRIGTPALNFDNQHTYRLVRTGFIDGVLVEVGPTLTVQDALVNMGPQFADPVDETTGVNVSAVRNSKGRFVIGSISNTDGGAPGPFWNATITNSVVDFDMLVQDDLYGAVTASNVLGGSDFYSDWPAPTLRSIGWQ